MTVWGLDVADGRLRMVHLVRSPRRSRLTHALSIRVAPDASEEQLAGLLRRAVEGSGIDTGHVAICLPTTAGYLHCCDADSPPPVAPDRPFVSDSWTVDDGDRTWTVTGSADRDVTERLIRVAESAGLRVMHVALPQMAAAAALGMLGTDARRGAHAGFVVDHAQVRFTLTRRQAPVLTRSTPRDRSDGSADPARIAVTIYRAAQMADGGDLPSQVSVIAGDEDYAAIEPIAAAVGVRLHRVTPGAAAGVACPGDPPRDMSDYAVPIGAALLAAGLTDRKMNLREALTHTDQPRPLIRRRFWVALAALVILGAVSLFVAEWVPKRMELTRLRRQYEAQLPLLERRRQATQAWELLHPWLSATQDGGRIEHLRILRNITESFPDPADAYVTDMSISVGRIGGPVNISLTGRAISSEVLHECIARLDDSEQFDAQPVRLSDVEQALTYPKHYVIPIAMKGAGDDRDSP